MHKKLWKRLTCGYMAALLASTALSLWSPLEAKAQSEHDGSELVVNGDFEGGEMSGWTSNYRGSFTSDDVTEDPLSKNGKSLHVTGRWNQWSVAAYEISEKLEGGMTYRFSVDVLYNEKTKDDQGKEYDAAETQDFLLQLGNAEDSERTKYYKQIQTVKTGEWTTISFEYTVPFEVSDSVWLNLETNGGSYPQNRTNFYVDNVSVKEIGITDDAAYALKKLNILQYYPEYQAQDGVTLPNEIDGYALTWSSSKPEVLNIGDNNQVTYTKTEEDTVVKFTVKAGDATKNFYIESKRSKESKSLMESENMTSRPALGWNSFDGYICSVTEKQILENAEFIAGTGEVFKSSDYKKSLKDLGYEYIVVDQAWFMDAYTEHQPNKYTLPNYRYFGKDSFRINENGYWVVDEERFPSAVKEGYNQPQSVGSTDAKDAVVKDNNGFKALADKIHGMGLKFGIHLQSGIPKTAVELKLPIEGCDGVTADMVADFSDECVWNDLSYGIDMSKPGAQEYLNNEIKRYAEWGVDFLKIDDLAQPYHEELIKGYRKAIDNCGREMYLSASPGPTSLDVYEKISSNANMWRIIDDLWDRWEGNGLNHVIDTAQKWTDKISEYHYPDGDMVPFGQLEGGRFSKFSDEEKRSLMTLYAMIKSPIMLGGRMNGYLGVNDDAEFSWLADEKDYDDLKYVINEDFIDINQNAVNVELVKESSTAPVWTSESADGTERYLGFINATGYYPEGNEWADKQAEEPASVQNFTVNLAELDSECTYVSAREVWTGQEVPIVNNTVTMELKPEDAALIVVTTSASEKKVESISVKAPEKTKYLLGEELITDQMKITVTYTDGSTEEITKGYNVDGYDSEKIGKQTITVSYEGCKATFEVEILGLPFEDVTLAEECSWYYREVYDIYYKEIIKGVDPTHFEPLSNLARAQFAIILHNMEKNPGAAYEPKFKDVEDKQWYTNAIMWASSKEIVTGYEDGSQRFGWGDNILREQMAVMMYRYAKNFKNYNISDISDFDKFEDAAKVSGYAKEAMKWAVGAGIITGKDLNQDGTPESIDPLGNASRAECAVIIQRFMEKYN